VTPQDLTAIQDLVDLALQESARELTADERSHGWTDDGRWVVHQDLLELRGLIASVPPGMSGSLRPRQYARMLADDLGVSPRTVDPLKEALYRVDSEINKHWDKAQR